MGGAIRADHAAAVDREQHIELLHRHVVHQLVVAALQEGGIDRHHGLGTVHGHARGQGHRVLLGDGHVEIALRVFLAETHQARALAHRRGDRQQRRLGRGHVADPVAEHVGVGRRLGARLGHQTLARIERAHGVVADLVALGQFVALALGGDDVQQLRTLEGLERLQRAEQRRQVVAVDRAGVVEAHFLEQRGRHEHTLPVLFPAPHEACGGVALLVAEDLLAALADGVEGLAAAHPPQHLGDPADRLGDRHAVVVEDHQQIRFRVHTAGVVQRLVGHARGHRAVADHRHHLTFVAHALQRHRHAQRGRDRGGGMADAEGVVLAFLALGERRHAIGLLDRVDAVAAPGEDLVRIGLVADVPHQLVDRRVVEVVQGDGEFDHAQPGAEVAAALADALDQKGAQFLGDGRQLRFIEATQFGGDLDAREARIAGGVDHRNGGSADLSFSSPFRARAINPFIRGRVDGRFRPGCGNPSQRA
ncbi:hypothetical protein NB706_002481 [Xanthomonas sacchari]|nr:hypothetical protein [Xanthomonas sacchari]